MPKAIPFIPHRHRVEKHKVDYLRAIADSMDYPYQSEDGRDLAPIQQKLAEYKNEVEEKTFPIEEHFINSNIQIEKNH